MLSDLDDDDPRCRYLYSLIVLENAQKAYSLYESSNVEDIKKKKPCLKEPEAGSELQVLTQGYFGIETLNRICLNVHPAALDSIVLQSTLNDDLTAEKLKIERPHQVEEYLIRRHRHTIEGEDEGITCSLCFPTFEGADKISQIKKFSRQGYVAHYRRLHLSAVNAITAFNEIGTSGRIYEAFVLYISCLTQSMMKDELSDSDEEDRTTLFTGVADAFEAPAFKSRRKYSDMHAETKGKGKGKSRKIAKEKEKEKEMPTASLANVLVLEQNMPDNFMEGDEGNEGHQLEEDPNEIMVVENEAGDDPLEPLGGTPDGAPKQQRQRRSK